MKPIRCAIYTRKSSDEGLEGAVSLMRTALYTMHFGL